MFRDAPTGRPPPPFYPASQQQQQTNVRPPETPGLRSRAVPIVVPSGGETSTDRNESSEISKAAAPSSDAVSLAGSTFSKATGTGSSGSGSGSGNGIGAPVSNDPISSSPLKGALSARAAAAAVFVPKSAVATQTSLSSSYEHGNSRVELDETESRSTGPMLGDLHLEESLPKGSFQNLNAASNVHTHAQYNESGRRTPSSYGLNGRGNDSDGLSSAFDPTYSGSLSMRHEFQPDHTHRSTAHTSAALVTQGNRQGARSFNPYEHMNEYGEPTTGIAAAGMPTQGVDYYGPSGRSVGLELATREGGTGGAIGSATGVASAAGGNSSLRGGGDFLGSANAVGALGVHGQAKVRQPLQYHLYNPPLPHVSNLHPQHLSAHAFFLGTDHREELQRKNDAAHFTSTKPGLDTSGLPDELHVYHSLVPLEPSTTSSGAFGGLAAQLIDPRIAPPSAPGSVMHLTGGAGMISKVFGLRNHVYKATCNLDGKAYVLRRLADYRLKHEAAISLVENWRKIRHASITSVREAFTTRAFGDHSLVFVYDFHPLATTLYGEHMVAKPPQPDPRTGRLQPVQMHVSERTLWSYACQLTNAIRCIHRHGMAARCIEASKILRTGKNRVRINCCSIFDVLTFDTSAKNQQLRQSHQSEDLFDLGKLLVSLACNSMTTVTQQSVSKSIEQISRNYSSEFKKLVVWLLAKPTPQTLKTAEELTRLLAPHMADEIDSALNYSDLLDSALTKELENARLVRLLCKFGFINERPEFDHDPRWSETGDRYIVKLFRDHIFHAIDESGRPVVDLSHILTNLNKLDAGSEERIVLTSRDEQSCLVVSFAEIKACIESAFGDLTRPR